MLTGDIVIFSVVIFQTTLSKGKMEESENE